MSAGDGKQKPAQKPGAPAAKAPQLPVARPHQSGHGESAFDLAPVGGNARSAQSLPRVANPFGSDEKTSTSMPNLPKIGGASSNNLPQVGPKPLIQPPPRKSNVIQKRLASSGFNEFYDGETPAPEVVDRETWRAVKAPLQSRPKRRSGRTLWSVIDQFAVANNPRYSVSNPAADLRAHVFAWDVSLAMECEIPHNRSGREMTLAQTVDWVRFECTYRGWRKVDEATALASSERGELVLAIAKDSRARCLAIVRPGGAGDDGRPRVSSAGKPKGNDLGVVEAVGALVDYYAHP